MFTKLLIANRGEIAVRIIRACKEMGIRTVAVYSKADAESIHVALADEAICIGEAAAKDSYLNQERIISAAIASKAQAIHPGYGFLAENASFAKLCKKYGIAFVGPSGELIDRMGDKDAARRLMKASGVPIIPGSSLAGALRHRIVTILLDMKMAGIKLPENINELVDIVFGYVHGDNACASNIIIGETEIKNTRPLTMVRTGVSRFESAVKQGTLYKEKTYVDGNLNVHIMVRKSEHPADEKWILGLLLLAIKDLQNGLLAVGGQTAIGRGIFEKQGPIVIDGKEGIEDAVIGELLKNMAEKGEVC